MTRFLAAPGRPQPPRTLTMQTTPRARPLPGSYLAPGDTDPSGGARPAHVACTARIIRTVLRPSGEPVTVVRGGSTASRECGLDVGALVGFGGEQLQHEVEADVVGAADLIQERLVGGDDDVQPLQAVFADRRDVGAVGEGELRGAGTAVEQLAGVGGDRAAEVADPVRQPACGGAGAAGELGQFVAEQEDRRALEPVDYRVGPQGGGDVVAVEAVQGAGDARGGGVGAGHELGPSCGGSGPARHRWRRAVIIEPGQGEQVRGPGVTGGEGVHRAALLASRRASAPRLPSALFACCSTAAPAVKNSVSNAGSPR